MFTLLEELAGLPFVGMDCVEVAPAYDHAELTVNAAHRVVFEALAGMAARRRDAAAGPPRTPRAAGGRR